MPGIIFQTVSKLKIDFQGFRAVSFGIELTLARYLARIASAFIRSRLTEPDVARRNLDDTRWSAQRTKLTGLNFVVDCHCMAAPCVNMVDTRSPHPSIVFLRVQTYSQKPLEAL